MHTACLLKRTIHNPLRPPVVATGQRSEPLLTRCVPDSELQSFVLEIDKFQLEVNACM